MKKNFTFILLSLLLLLGGAKVCAQTVNLPIKGGKDWSAWTEGYEKGTGWSASTPAASDQYSGTVKITNGNPKFSRLGGKGWSSSYNGQTQTFTMVLNNSIKNQWNQDVTAYTRFVLVAIKGGTYKSSGDTNDLDDYNNNNWDGNNQFKDGNGSNETKIVANSGVLTPTFVNNEATIQLEVNEDYDAVYFYTPDGDGGSKAIKIVSFTLTIGGGGSSVAAPTISPAFGTYDGELSVTITPGDGNDHVIYSVEGSNEDAKHTSINITSETTINLTGDGTITVTATGYDSENNPSSEVTNTYTYSVASGKTTAAVTYYNYKPVTIVQDDKTVAFFDFEDDTAIGNWGNGDNDDERAARKPTVIINTTDAVKGNKCMFIKNEYGVMDQDWHAEFGFNTPNDGDNIIYLTHGHTYYLHFWAKAEANTTVTMNFKNRGDWSTPHHYDVEIGTEWQEYTAYVFVPSWNASNFSVELGRNTVGLYFDDFGLFEVTSSTDATDFTDATSTAVVAASAFSGSAVGDLVQLNIVGAPTAVATQAATGYDQYQAYMTNLTPLEQTNGNWLIPVTSDIKSNGLSIKGYPMTLSSVNLFKKVVLDQDEDNTVTKYDNVAVYLDRTFVANTWNTVCLPFVPTAAQAEELFGSGYKIAKFTGVTGTTLEFTSNDAEAFVFVAGQPYLVKPTANLNTPVVLFDVDITAKNGATVPQGDYSFTGTFTTKSFAEGDWATTRFVATGNKLNTPNSTNAMKALRCYFTVPAKSLARGYAIDGFMDDDVPTDISATLNDNVQTTKVIYNLAGQRVANPTKGLYIVNGQKVVVK